MTVLRFDLPTETHATLKVCDPTGRCVATLVDKVMPAGSREFTWNGRGRNARKLSSGAYIYQLQAAGRTLTNKMTLIR